MRASRAGGVVKIVTGLNKTTPVCAFGAASPPSKGGEFVRHRSSSVHYRNQLSGFANNVSARIEERLAVVRHFGARPVVRFPQ